MKTIGEVIKHAEYIVNNRKDAISVCWSVKDCQQIAEWLRELQERRKADSCEGCIHLKDTDRFWKCPNCKRQYADKYDAERRTE